MRAACYRVISEPFSQGPLGGLYVEVKEEVWPRAKPLEVGPFWSFLYGLALYGFAHDIPEWMGHATAGRDVPGAVGDTYVPFLKIMADPDLYCFGKDGRISQWSHETGEFRAVDKSFAELLDFELAGRAKDAQGTQEGATGRRLNPGAAAFRHLGQGHDPDEKATGQWQVRQRQGRGGFHEHPT
jgi:hypothetical protein